MTARVPLRNRRGETVAFALVDDADLELVAGYRWSLSSAGYVAASPRRGVKLAMHRVILGLSKGDGLEGDHRNGDPLDNRRSNLRIGTRALNGQNVPARGGASRYRGVTFCRGRSKPWRVRIFNHGHVGYFATEDEARDAAQAWYAEHFPFAELERHAA